MLQEVELKRITSVGEIQWHGQRHRRSGHGSSTQPGRDRALGPHPEDEVRTLAQLYGAGSGEQRTLATRIHEALHDANMARAAAEDLADPVLVQATLRLAEALEAFAFSYADRLGEIDTPACDSRRDRHAGI